MKWLRTAALLFAVAACSDSDSTSPRTAAGVFELETVDGAALPVIIDQLADTTLEITAGTVSLDAGGSFTDRTDLRLTEGATVTTGSETAVGTWTQSGSVITFQPSGGAPYTMVLSGSTLTQQIFGLSLVYRR
jgi:hypothetical protein